MRGGRRRMSETSGGYGVSACVGKQPRAGQRQNASGGVLQSHKTCAEVWLGSAEHLME